MNLNADFTYIYFKNTHSIQIALLLRPVLENDVFIYYILNI